MGPPLKREKITQTVRDWLAAGRYAPGDRFPSDQELARKFGVTHVTVRSALRALVDEGTLERRIGWGTVVRDPATVPVAAADALAAAVGVAIPDSTHSFLNEVLRSIESALHPTKRPLVLGHTWELAAREQTVVRAWCEQGLTRLIVASSGGCGPFYEELLRKGVRLVFPGKRSYGRDFIGPFAHFFAPMVALMTQVQMQLEPPMLLDRAFSSSQEGRPLSPWYLEDG
jgi:DNA-binding transcriptional regulator YhcF (GntR family)